LNPLGARTYGCAMKRNESDAESPEAHRAVLTIAETAAIIGTSVRVIRKAIRDGEIESLKVGRTVYVLRAPLEAKLKTRIKPPGGAQ
jgi:excisionase family DNA binding protein